MPDRWSNPQGWGPPPRPRRPRPSNGGQRRRQWIVGLAAVSVVLGGVALGNGDDTNREAGPATTPPAASPSLPAVTTTTTAPTTTTAAPTTTIATVEVPKLVGMRLTSARAALAGRGLRATVRYRSTAGYPAGTVISQSRRTGAGVLPASRITVVVAKAPPPPPTTAPPPPTTSPSRHCDPSYPDVCLNPDAVDYDCAGGSGDGPRYVEGPIRVRPPDPFDLDGEGDGWGCERS
jgi:hypothetical protein